MNDSARATLARWAVAAPFAIFLIVYAPAVGHGFISDDFRWIRESRVTDWSGIVGIFSRHAGFYRPMVALSFAADAALFGVSPLGYGWTNLMLTAASAALLYALLRAVVLPRPAAAAGAAIWLLNLYGIEMATLWISGRTALLLTAASLAATVAAIRGRISVALIFLAVALLSKEEAIALPIIVAIWVALLDPASEGRSRRMLTWLAGAAVVVAIYAALRIQSGALTPASAPAFYRFTFAPSAVARNVAAYAVRTLAFPAGVVILAALFLAPACDRVRASRSRILAGSAWIAGGYALTLFLPVRSSLYVCFPSIGAAVLAADILFALWDASQPAGQRRAAAASIVLAAALAPVLWSRNHRWIDLADFSTSVLNSLDRSTAGLPDGSTVVLIDDRSKRVNLESTFGTLIEDAAAISTGRDLKIWVEPPLRDASLAGMKAPCEGCPRLTLRLNGNRVEK